MQQRTLVPETPLIKHFNTKAHWRGVPYEAHYGTHALTQMLTGYTHFYEVIPHQEEPDIEANLLWKGKPGNLQPHALSIFDTKNGFSISWNAKDGFKKNYAVGDKIVQRTLKDPEEIKRFTQLTGSALKLHPKWDRELSHFYYKMAGV